MELVKLFNSELSSLYESKPPISKAKMTSITRTAIKAIKLYKHVVQSVEKFIQKCKPEYKVPGLYVIDSIVRQSRHQFGTEKDVFAPRFARNLQQTFVYLFNCPAEDKSKVIRVLNLWQKNAVFDSEVIQPLFDLADPNHPLYKEQATLPSSNGITPVKPVPPANVIPKNASLKKEGSTAGWVNQINTDPNVSSLHSSQSKSHTTAQAMDANILQQLQQLQTLLLDQQVDKAAQAKDDQIKFDKKLLDFDYDEEEDEDGPPAHHHQQQPPASNLDSIGSILSNPEILRQLQTLQQTLSNPQHLRQQQLDMEEKMRKMQEMKQQEEEFDKHLAQTVPNLPFADECDLKPGGEVAAFPGTDFSQPPPGYPHQQKMMVMPGMMMKPPPSPLEDGEHASSDADERMMGHGEEGGPSVVVLDSDSPNDSPAHRRRRRRSRSHSHSRRRSRSDSRSRSRGKRKRSSSYEDKDWEKSKMREAEKERERERKRKGLPSIKKNHIAVCSTTLWIGHLSKLVQQEELSDTFGEFGDIVSIDLIPPRGCAFICMNRRQDAFRALQDLKHCKLQGKTITLAWAPGKGMKGKEYKDYWEVDQGVSYIPWIKLTPDIDLDLIEEGGMIDEESLPEWLKDKQKKHKDDDNQRSQSSSQAEDDDTSKGTELDIPVPAPTLPGFIPLPDGPQPLADMKVNQPPPNMPPPMMSAGPPLGMMPPPFLPNVPRLLGPMGMAMGPGLMPNVPLGVPPPGMQGLMGNPLMHQQMMGRMPQPVGSPFNHPPGVSLLGGHPQLSQIPLPGSQDKNKPGLPPLGVPPPNDVSGLPPFTDPMMQIPFTLPPQLQMPGIGMLGRSSLTEKITESSVENDKKNTTSPSRNNSLMGIQPPFGQPPPQFSPMSLMKIPPPMSVPPPESKIENANNSEDKDERELKDKDYREKDYKDRDKERDRDFRNKRDRDYRGDRDYRDRFDKDYRERDKDYRDRGRERRERDKDDKLEDNKFDEKDKKEDVMKEDKNYREKNDRDRSRNRDRDRERERERGRDRGGKWGDRDRDRGRDRERDERRGRDRERDRSKEMKGADREKSVQDRSRNLSLEKERGNEFRSAMEPENFQGRGVPRSRSDSFHQDGFTSDMHGRPHGNRHEAFDNRGPRDLFDHRGLPPDGFDPRGPPPDGFNSRGPPPDSFNSRGPPSDGFGPRGPPPDGFGTRGPIPEGFGPRGPHLDGFGSRGPPPDGFGLRGPPPDGFGSRGPPDGFDRRGPPPDGFDPRGPPPDGFDPRGPPPGNFGPPDGFDPRGPPPDFDGLGPPGENFNMRGPPPDNFNRGILSDKFGSGGPPSDFAHRGPPAGEEFGGHGHPFEGFSGPPGEFQPRIRIEFFSRGRGRGLVQDTFRGRGGRGSMFSGRGGGPRGPRPGTWMEAQGPSPPKAGFGGFLPRIFATSESDPERFGLSVFEDSSRGRGGLNLRGRGRGFQGRQDEHRREEEDREIPSPKRISRWSNPSPPPGYVAPGVEQQLEFELEPRLRDIENTDSGENMDLVQQESNDGNVIKVNEEGPVINENDATVANKGNHDMNEAKFNEDSGKQCMEEISERKSFINNESSSRHFLDSASHQEERDAFLDIGNDSSSMQLSNIDSIKEHDASLLFTQDSQSMADVEMSDSHLNFESSNKDEPETFLDTSKNNDTAARSFADVGLSFTEDNEDLPTMGHQHTLSRSEENLSKFMNPPAELFDDSINKETPNLGTNDQVLGVKEVTLHNSEHRNFDFTCNIDQPQAVTSQLNMESDMPEMATKEFLVTNSSLFDNMNSSFMHNPDQNEHESTIDNDIRESVDTLTEEQILPIAIEPEVQSNTTNEPFPCTVEFGQVENALTVSENNTLSEESSAAIEPSVLHEQSNS